MIMVPAIALQLLFYRPPNFHQLHGGKRTLMQEVERIDYVGLLLLIAGLCLFILGVSWGKQKLDITLPASMTDILSQMIGGEPLSWTSGTILGLLISGGVSLIAFVLWGELLHNFRQR